MGDFVLCSRSLLSLCFALLCSARSQVSVQLSLLSALGSLVHCSSVAARYCGYPSIEVETDGKSMEGKKKSLPLKGKRRLEF
jgi:hypothetical protein